MYSENFPSEIDLLIFFESEPFLKIHHMVYALGISMVQS